MRRPGPLGIQVNYTDLPPTLALGGEGIREFCNSGFGWFRHSRALCYELQGFGSSDCGMCETRVLGGVAFCTGP